jgi:hypothetical protein
MNTSIFSKINIYYNKIYTNNTFLYYISIKKHEKGNFGLIKYFPKRIIRNLIWRLIIVERN